MLGLDSLLRLGFFPKELPPTFHTRAFADFVKSQGKVVPQVAPSRKHLISNPANHSLARPGQLRRRVQIWNPFSYLALSNVLAEGETEIVAHFQKSSISRSLPIVDDTGKRSLVREHTGNYLPVIRAEQRATGRFLLRSDLSRFYHTIYTHSIPWALHGKAWAKSNRIGGLGNSIDEALRNGQDGQTLGIPVGPDSSLVVSEVVACAIDTLLQERFPRAYRFVDDFEVAFDSRSEAEAGLAFLEEVVAKFELALNSAKTTIDALPQPLETDWQRSIRSFDFDVGDPDSADLLRYFNLVFELQQKQPTEGVIGYAIARLRAISVDEDVWPLLQSLLFQCAVVEPASLTHMFSLLGRHFEMGIAKSLPTVLDKIIQSHSPLGHGSEVAWALWGSLRFDVQLADATAKAVSRNTDPVVALCALHVQDRGLVEERLDTGAWEGALHVGELYDRNWILTYEALQQGWLPAPASGDPALADPNFVQLRKEGVSFYDLDEGMSMEEREEEEYEETFDAY